MVVQIDEFYKEFYEQGHLDYTLSNLSRFESIEEWKEWLATEPIAYFSNKTEWTMEDGLITYLHDTEDQEQYEPSLMIELNEEYLLHSSQGSQSFFFRLLDDDKVEAIYVD